jgi:hypothetical protein
LAVSEYRGEDISRNEEGGGERRGVQGGGKEVIK